MRKRLEDLLEAYKETTVGPSKPSISANLLSIQDLKNWFAKIQDVEPDRLEDEMKLFGCDVTIDDQITDGVVVFVGFRQVKEVRLYETESEENQMPMVRV